MEEEMSEDEYQMKQFFEKKRAVTIIESDSIRVTFIPHPLFDEPQEKKLFCEEVKTNNNDKTI